ncbi:MAG: chloride channel protein [Planctomycetota bacterium]
MRGLWMMTGLALLVGLVSGLMAAGLRMGVQTLFGALEALRSTLWGLLLPAAGALAGVWIVRLLFREPGGHGVPAVLESVSRKGGSMRRRSIISRLLGSLVHVAGGGSAGLEGPIAFSAAAVGSSLAPPLKLAERQRILLVACGVAGGIGAIFNAPLTGLIFATEVVLAEWSLAAVIPIAVSATTATELGRLLLGGAVPLTRPTLPIEIHDLAACALLGALAGLLSVLLVRAVRGVEQVANGLRKRGLTRRMGIVAALAGLGVGALGWFFPGAIGEGYDTLRFALEDPLREGLLVGFLLLAAKFLATALSLGSGAPGGIFAPALVVGALFGRLFGETLGVVLPQVSFAPAGSFALVGMAGLVAGTMQAPFTGIFLVLETTSGWELTLPLMLVSVLGVLVARNFQRHSFYTWELVESGRLLRPGTDRRILADLQVGENLDGETMEIETGRTLEDLVRRLPFTRRNHFAVVEPGSRRYLGMIDIAGLRAFLFDPELRRATLVETVMETTLPWVAPGQSLLETLELFESSGAWVLPVVREGVFEGTLSKATLFDRYRSELAVQTSEMT